MKDLNAIFTLLFSARKLDRDQGVNDLKEFLNCAKRDDIHTVEQLLLRPLSNASGDWESKHGSLLGAKTVIVHVKELGFDKETEEFLQAVFKLCMQLLTDSEVRIRLAAGGHLNYIFTSHSLTSNLHSLFNSFLTLNKK